ncbi:MAG: hypothetical protein ACK5YZ_00445 [bacterium]|jgi:hypothetical protein
MREYLLAKMPGLRDRKLSEAAKPEEGKVSRSPSRKQFGLRYALEWLNP